MEEKKELKFPGGFYWGAATSSHQVEGGDINDWSAWEKENAVRLSQIANQKHWPGYILEYHLNPLQPENYISGRACDHYHRFEQDFDIVKQLCHNAHRFSIEWSRVEPEEGKFNEEEIEHYRRIIQALKSRGIEPFVTIWHWTLPLWFRDLGGWENKSSINYFVRYAERMTQEFPEVKFWITLNETNAYTGFGYWRGVWPPEKKSLIKYLKANHYLSQAHIAAYQVIKKINPTAHVGVAHNTIYFKKFPAGLKSHIHNRFFLNSIKRYQDFIGVNYYYSDRETNEHSEFLNRSIDPEGLRAVLKQIADYKKPIYITENGIADARDEKRAKFIKEHLKQIHKAIEEGADVRGYFYWSLLDNFEWDKGFWPRFGLVEIDYKTQERKIRPSAFEYAKICKNNALEL